MRAATRRQSQSRTLLYLLIMVIRGDNRCLCHILQVVSYPVDTEVISLESCKFRTLGEHPEPVVDIVHQRPVVGLYYPYIVLCYRGTYQNPVSVPVRNGIVICVKGDDVYFPINQLFPGVFVVEWRVYLRGHFLIHRVVFQQTVVKAHREIFKCKYITPDSDTRYQCICLVVVMVASVIERPLACTFGDEEQEHHIDTRRYSSMNPFVH